MGLANPNQAVWTARPAGPALLSLRLSLSLTFSLSLTLIRAMLA